MDRPLRVIRGARVRERRRELGMRATHELAARVKVAPKTIELLERGDVNTGDETLEAVARALEWTRDQLDGDLRLRDGDDLNQLRSDVAIILRTLEAQFPDDVRKARAEVEGAARVAFEQELKEADPPGGTRRRSTS